MESGQMGVFRQPQRLAVNLMALSLSYSALLIRVYDFGINDWVASG